LLVFPGGEGDDAHAFYKEALTLWERGEDVMDYRNPIPAWAV